MGTNLFQLGLANGGERAARTLHGSRFSPLSPDEHIKAALRGGSTTFVIDNIEELHKLLPYRQRIGLLLRVSFRSDSAIVDLSRKFGCVPDQVLDIVRQACGLGANIRGLSFHVGSQSLTPDTHVDAIHQGPAAWMRFSTRSRN